ncbi:sigma-70 family RNA polymerase sigma factor [Nocardioides humilatus]|uniref:Sigma-70 family RNA polymerase sigma factor n=1 Tax=Nocardioides humilatus TaxID=2607660 RepID=A0A5B1LNC0_9ACTN|nr:sigma-70 family RNA polymerase sigma factor [Nocardioides humilatus]KAA1421107.1 sigma-70 family RNA polymerase sigma factor [Nocardioides humilatus]
MRAEVIVSAVRPDDFASYVAVRSHALQRFAYLMSGDAAESADLVQEALARAYPRWRGLVKRGTHDAYVKRSIVNGSIDRWRKLGRVVPVADVSEYDGRTAPAVDGTTDADEAWRLCAELPPVQRAAVVLRFHEDLAFAQIAEVLDCAEATARSHVHRALASLRGRLTTGVDDD